MIENKSSINYTIKKLQKENQFYILHYLDVVEGMPLRALEYINENHTFILAETIYRTHTEDSVVQDWIFSKEFWETIKDKWPMEVCAEKSYHTEWGEEDEGCNWMMYDDFFKMVNPEGSK